MARLPMQECGHLEVLEGLLCRDRGWASVSVPSGVLKGTGTCVTALEVLPGAGVVSRTDGYVDSPWSAVGL